MKNYEYYVYALIDPRNNQYFYIGKGKGKRYLSHLKTNKWDFNLTKLEKIKDIQKNGYEVKVEILIPNIDEETAFELERILIYKLGRTILSEGILTNMVPGGKWNKKESVLYSDKFKSEFDITKLDLFAQEKFSSINKFSDFDYLNIKSDQQTLYKYSTDGNLDIIESLNCFLLKGFQGDTIELLKVIRENNLPIYLRSIYSKHYFKKIYISNILPFADFDIIDEQFNKDFDKLYNEKECFEISLILEGVQRMLAIKENDLITLHSFYLSGNKKSFGQTKSNKRFNESVDWFENGNFKIKETYKEEHSGFSRTTYYENGNKYIEITNFDSKKTYERWFESGKKEVELIENIGYVYYNEIGMKIKTEPLIKKTIDPQEEINLNFTKKVELTEEMKIEKAKADLDWLEYCKNINS